MINKIDPRPMVAGITGLGFQLSNVNELLTCVSLLLAIGYTVWRWNMDKNNKPK